MPKWYTKNLESLDYSWLICHPKNEGFFQSFQVNPKLAGDSPLIKHLTLCCPLCWHSIFFSPIVVAYFSSCSPSFIFDFFFATLLWANLHNANAAKIVGNSIWAKLESASGSKSPVHRQTQSHLGSQWGIPPNPAHCLSMKFNWLHLAGRHKEMQEVATEIHLATATWVCLISAPVLALKLALFKDFAGAIVAFSSLSCRVLVPNPPPDVTWQ